MYDVINSLNLDIIYTLLVGSAIYSNNNNLDYIIVINNFNNLRNNNKKLEKLGYKQINDFTYSNNKNKLFFFVEGDCRINDYYLFTILLKDNQATKNYYLTIKDNEIAKQQFIIMANELTRNFLKPKTITNQDAVICSDDFDKVLDELNIEKDDSILVHASMKKIGYMVGGSQTYLECLLKKVSDGNIIMPSQSGENSNPEDWSMPYFLQKDFELIKTKTPNFDPFITPTRAMSKLVDTFRFLPDIKRSHHPNVSFVAYGKDAAFITKNHSLSYCLGFNSPLGKLYQMKKSKILLIGCDWNNATALHLAEVIARNAKVIKKEGMINGKWQTFDDYDYDNSTFLEVGKTLEKLSSYKQAKLGNGIVKIIDFKKSVDSAAKYFIDSQND